MLCSASLLFVLILDLLPWDRRYSLKEPLYVLSITFISVLLLIYSMDVKASKRFTDQRERSFSDPINGRAWGRVGGGRSTNKVVFVYFLEGRCNRNPCRFAHTESPSLPVSNPKLAKKSLPSYNYLKNNVWVSSGSEDRIAHVQKNSSLASSTASDEFGDKSTSEKTTSKNVCRHWLLGNCVRGGECRFLHLWFCGEGLTMLAKLEGHEKVLLMI